MAVNMGIMDSMNRNRRVGSAGLVLLFLIPSVSLGAEFGGGIRIGVSHTDNVFLSVSPNEIDDIVYQASPWLSFIHESSQLDANCMRASPTGASRSSTRR